MTDKKNGKRTNRAARLSRTDRRQRTVQIAFVIISLLLIVSWILSLVVNT